MTSVGGNDFTVHARERIQVRSVVDKAPDLAAFQTTPNGGSWESTKQSGLIELRIFTAPPAGKLSFNIDFDEQIADGDPDPVAHYVLTISSISRPGDPPFTSPTNVPQGAGPVSCFFTFTVA